MKSGRQLINREPPERPAAGGRVPTPQKIFNISKKYTRNPGCPEYESCLDYYSERDGLSWTCEDCRNQNIWMEISHRDLRGWFKLAAAILMPETRPWHREGKDE